MQANYRGPDAAIQGGRDPLQPDGSRRGQDHKVQQVCATLTLPLYLKATFSLILSFCHKFFHRSRNMLSIPDFIYPVIYLRTKFMIIL